VLIVQGSFGIKTTLLQKANNFNLKISYISSHKITKNPQNIFYCEIWRFWIGPKVPSDVRKLLQAKSPRHDPIKMPPRGYLSSILHQSCYLDGTAMLSAWYSGTCSIHAGITYWLLGLG